MKVCSLYGAGFFYVPGTDTCLKIGMYLRAEHTYGAGGENSAPGYYIGGGGTQGPDNLFTRDATDFYTFRARINLSTDWRTQTDYGVLRAYAMTQIQASTSDLSGVPGSTTGAGGLIRAFIQFAGFTVGHAVSYFDFFNGADYGYAPSIWGASTGVNGTDLIAYTWQLGNGWSASLDLEDGQVGRPHRVVNATPGLNAFTLAGTGVSINNSPQGAWVPDFAGNIRIDQAWGSAQLSGALHNINASYYSTPGAVGTPVLSTLNGHPGDAWGWAVQGGFRLLNVFQPKNRFEASAYYCDGAIAYCVNTPNAAPFGSGNTLALGWAVDGVFVNGSSIEKTESWGVQAAYEHFWNAQWRTAVVGGYAEVNYNSTATAWLCGAGGLAGAVRASGITTTNCSPNFSETSVSTRTAWNPHPLLEIGLDLIWWHVDTAYAGAATVGAPLGSRPAGAYTIEDQDRFLAILRVQKTVLP